MVFKIHYPLTDCDWHLAFYLITFLNWIQPKIWVIFLTKLSHFSLNSQRNILEYSELISVMTLFLYHLKWKLSVLLSILLGRTSTWRLACRSTSFRYATVTDRHKLTHTEVMLFRDHCRRPCWRLADAPDNLMWSLCRRMRTFFLGSRIRLLIKHLKPSGSWMASRTGGSAWT